LAEAFLVRISLFVLAALISGCSTAGPFVTNVSSAGPNKLLIEKCQVELNAFVGYVTNKGCSTNTIELQTK
jgi:type IV secretion system protein VirB7